MIILDTNVVSELMKPAPADRVIRWVASQTATSLYTTSITYAEILHGILLLRASGAKTLSSCRDDVRRGLRGQDPAFQQ